MSQATSPSKAPASPRTTWLRRGLALAFLALVCAAAFWVGSLSQASSANGGLTVAEESLHFGEAWQNMRFPWTLQIHNPTASTVVVEKFGTSCPCAAIEPLSLRLEPGETASVNLALDLARYGRGDGDLRDFSVKITPVIQGDVNDQPGWIIDGKVRQCMTLRRASLDFPEALIQGQPFPSGSVKVICHPKVREITPLFDRALLSVELVREDSETYRLDITPRAPLPAGFFRSDIAIDARLEDGSTAHAVTVPVKGMVRQSVGFIPDNILLGVRNVGDTVEQLLTLRSLNGESFVIEEIKNPSSDITIEPAPGDTRKVSADFRLHCRIGREGFRTHQLRFIVRVGKDDQTTLAPLTISYHGRMKVAPTKRQSPGSEKP